MNRVYGAGTNRLTLPETAPIPNSANPRPAPIPRAPIPNTANPEEREISKRRKRRALLRPWLLRSLGLALSGIGAVWDYAPFGLPVPNDSDLAAVLQHRARRAPWKMPRADVLPERHEQPIDLDPVLPGELLLQGTHRRLG